MQSILIADDEQGIRDLIDATLGSPDCRILQAADGATALALARSNLPDLIILDWMMPKLTGPEVVGRLRADSLTAHIPVILLTGLGDEMHRRRGAGLGAVAYLVKPFSPLQLMEIVQQVLSERIQNEHHAKAAASLAHSA